MKKKLSNNNNKEYDKNFVFVAMPINGDTTDIYNAIKDECSKLDLKALRIDENTGAGSIIDEIKQSIEDAEFLIIDLTEERPNVYYELGYAHGVGNDPLDILLIAKKGTNPHFNTSGLRIELYESTEHLRSIVSSKLNIMIEKTREVA